MGAEDNVAEATQTNPTPNANGFVPKYIAVPEGVEIPDEQIKADDPRLAAMWEQAALVAIESGREADYDRIVEQLGAPKRKVQQVYRLVVDVPLTVSVDLGGFTADDEAGAVAEFERRRGVTPEAYVAGRYKAVDIARLAYDWGGNARYLAANMGGGRVRMEVDPINQPGFAD